MRTALLVLALASALLLAGCTDPGAGTRPPSPPSTPPTPPPPAPARGTATYVATDYAFAGPESIAGGWVDVTMRNDGKEPHQAHFVLIGNHTMEEFQQAMMAMSSPPPGNDSMGNDSMPSGGHGMPAWMKMAGGPNAADPGKSSTATIKLEQGNAVVLCFVPGPDGRPHFMHGMVKLVRVTAAPSGTQPAPKADVDVSLTDFAFAQAPTPTRGAHIFKVTNDGVEPHEATLFLLKGNSTVQDILNFNGSAPPSFSAMGGMTGLSAGGQGWFNATLETGRYAYICFEGSPPHFTKGMVLEFAVA